MTTSIKHSLKQGFLVCAMLTAGFFVLGHEAKAAPLSGLNADLDGMLIATGTATTVLTTAANNATANDTWLATSTQSSAYFGMNYFFKQLTFNIGTAGTVGVVAWEYCSAATATCTAWTALSPTDGTNSFKTAGTNDVTINLPSDPVWVTSTIFDGAGRYYVRARQTTGYTVYPLATQISAIEFNSKLKVANELGTGLTGLLSGAFYITNCTVTTTYAFREISTGYYELGLLTQGADTNCDYTTTSSGYVRSVAAATGALSTESVTGTAASLPFAYKVNSVAVESISSTIATVTVSAGSNSGVSCTESGGAWYCPVPVAHTELKIQTVKDGYVTASSSLFTADRTAETDAQITGTVTGVPFAVKVTTTAENGGVVSGAAVTAGDSNGITCAESGVTGVYYCAVPIAHTGTAATLSKSGYVTISGTYTDRTANANAQSLLALVVNVSGGGGSAAILSVSASVSPSPITAGGQVTYTLTVGNTGNLSAPNVVVSDRLPAGFTFASDGTNTKTVTTIALLSPGPAKTVSYTVNVGPGVSAGTYLNDARVVSSLDSNTLYAQAPLTVLAAGQTPSPSPTPTPVPSPSASPTPSALPQPYGEKAAVTLYRIEGDPRVYAVVNNTRRHIPNIEAFNAAGFKWSDVQVLPPAQAPQYRDANLLRGQGDAKVYVLENGKKRWVTSAEEFTKAGHRWEDILDVPTEELAAYPQSSGAVFILIEGVTALNVRNAPALDGKRLGRIFSNQEVEKLGAEGKWYQVRVGALEGWAHGGFLKKK